MAVVKLETRLLHVSLDVQWPDLQTLPNSSGVNLNMNPKLLTLQRSPKISPWTKGVLQAQAKLIHFFGVRNREVPNLLTFDLASPLFSRSIGYGQQAVETSVVAACNGLKNHRAEFSNAQGEISRAESRRHPHFSEVPLK